MDHFNVCPALVIAVCAAAMAVASTGCSDPGDAPTLQHPGSENVSGRPVESEADANAKAGRSSTTAGDFMSDAWITSRIKSTLLGDELGSGFEVNVETVDGWVTLSGDLVDREAAEYVRSLVENIEGVRGVDISRLNAVARM